MSVNLLRREDLLNEYFQAVDLYQKAVLALKEARVDYKPDHFPNLLSQADIAQQTLNFCRDRYHQYCAALGN